MSKIKINLNKAFLEIDGEVADKSNMGKAVGNFFASSNKGDAIKLFAWGIDLFKGNEIEVDESDFKTIRDMVNESPSFNNLMKAQLLKELDKAKDDSNKPNKDEEVAPLTKSK